MLEILLKDTLVHLCVPSHRQTHHDIMPVRERVLLPFFFFLQHACDCVYFSHESLDVLKFSRSRTSRTCINTRYLKLVSREITRFECRIRFEFLKHVDIRDNIFASVIPLKKTHV